MVDLNTLKKKSNNDSLEYIYSEIDKYLFEKNGILFNKKLKEIDNLILSFLNDNDLLFKQYMGLLTVTYNIKHRLKNRKLLWNKCKRVYPTVQFNFFISINSCRGVGRNNNL